MEFKTELSPITALCFEYFAGSKERSDLHFKENNPPVFRIEGELETFPIGELGGSPVIDNAYAKQFIHDLYRLRWGDDKGKVLFEEFLENGYQDDFAVDITTDVRARVNIYKSMGTLNAALRQIPAEMPVLENIGFDGVHQNVIKATLAKREGLILITGQTGSGKSTTLASFINYINRTHKKHVVTIEDPVEFRHKNEKSLISHREIGSDTETFFTGLRASLREDPDIILVGEMRDPETALAAMQAAQTGHIVLATLHTNSAPETVTRLLDMFPPEKSDSIRTSLAQALLMIISQKLPPTLAKKRALCYEIMLNNQAIKSTITNDKQGYDTKIKDIMQAEIPRGMIPMPNKLANMVKATMIDEATAREYCGSSKDDQNRLNLALGKPIDRF